MIDWGVILLEKIRCLSLLWVKGQIEGVPGGNCEEELPKKPVGRQVLPEI